MSKKKENDSRINCPDCQAQLKKENLKNHMQYVHNKIINEINTKPLDSSYKKNQRVKLKKLISKTIIGILVIIFILIIALLYIYCSFNPTNSNVSIDKKNYIVSLEGTGDFLSIQEAINSASINDTIYVDKGTYFENIKIKKSIELIGEDKNTTIINGNGSGIVINISADYVKINSFTIKNGGSLSDLESDAGINIESNYNKISNCNISSNKNYGIYLNANPNASNNTLKYNTFFNNKYGIYLYCAETNNISSNIFSSNSKYGIYFGRKSNNNVISKNIMEENEYAIRILTSDKNRIINNIIMNNNFGLYFCCGATDNTAYNNVFINNANWNANDSLGNIWDNGMIGNYWDDYNGTDIDGDGIGDTPYINNLNNGNGDRFPIMKPNNNT